MGLPNGVGNHEEEGNAKQEFKSNKNCTEEGKEMYGVKRPYVLPLDVQLPNVMYAVTPINDTNSSEPASVSNSTHDVLGGRWSSRGTLTANLKSDEAQSSHSGDAMINLEQKQLKIIEQLKSLQDVITNIHKKSFIGTIIGSTSVVSNICDGKKLFTNQDNIDVVIHANPNKAPFSLMFFANLFEKNYENAVVSIKSHIHSSFKGTVNIDALSVFNQERDDANLRFTLIWKNVDSCTTIITPIQSTHILGEANLARFLSRLLPNINSSLNYDCLNWEGLVRVDSLLDAAYEENVVSMVEKELKNTKTNFLTGQPTIADLVLYSSVASKLVNGEKNTPDSVKNWFRNMEIMFGFHSCMN